MEATEALDLPQSSFQVYLGADGQATVNTEPLWMPEPLGLTLSYALMGY